MLRVIWRIWTQEREGRNGNLEKLKREFSEVCKHFHYTLANPEAPWLTTSITSQRDTLRPPICHPGYNLGNIHQFLSNWAPKCPRNVQYLSNSDETVLGNSLLLPEPKQLTSKRK